MVERFNQVEVDIAGRAQLATLMEYAQLVSPRTLRTAAWFASATRRKGLALAFFSATPQGGGVALMRHALIRYLRLENVKCNW